jgi:hypothetical protein
MANWLLICPNCNYRFTHNNIEPTTMEESYRNPFKIVARPKFPDGEKIACPNRKVESEYQAYQLIYSGDDEAEAAGAD